MEKIVKPIKAISFEAALRNLACRLTGTPVAELPRTQEAIVQYMAENVPAPSTGGVNVDELVEAVTQEVMARITESVGANLAATEPPAAAQDGAEGAGGTSTPPATETPQEAPQTVTEAPKTTRKTPKAKAET
jgi:hypothetical protein